MGCHEVVNMSNTEKLQPALRLKTFNTEWNKNTLSSVADVYDGTHQTPEYTDSGVMFLSAENIKTLKSNKFISEKSFHKEFKVSPTTGDVLMTRIGDVGTANVIEDNTPKAYYVTLALLKLKDLDPYFLKASITAPFVQKDIWYRTLHIAFPKKINMNEVTKVVINTPESKEEQKQIGEFFKAIDHQLMLHQTKFSKLHQLKKAMLGKLFPQKGSIVPEIRFTGFNESWKELTLKNVCTEFKSGKFIRAKEIKKTGMYPVYGGNGIRGYHEHYNHNGVYALIGRQGALCGNMNISYGKAYFTEHAIAVKANELHDTIFLYHKLKLMNLGQYSGQSAQPGLSVTKLLELPILLPTKHEQRKIGEYFHKLDRLIALQQKQISKLENIKQSFLEKMFV